MSRPTLSDGPQSRDYWPVRLRRPLRLVRARLLDLSRGRWVGFASDQRTGACLQVDVSLDQWETQVATRLLIERLARGRRRFAVVERGELPPKPRLVSPV